MIFKIRFGKMKLTITLAPVIDVIGVNSLLPDGNHILMWDFDDKPLDLISASLRLQQYLHDLPKIRILETRLNKGYIAYCLTRCTLNKAIEIISGTQFICYNFLKWGTFRKRFTLRVTPKEGRKPKLVALLYSKTKEDVTVSELTSWVKDTLSAESYPFSSCPRQACLLGDRAQTFSLSPKTSAQNTRHSQTKHQ